MPESDERRELGGLARSIDALFSQERADAETTGMGEPEVPEVPEDEVPEDPDDVASESVPEAASGRQAAFESDPFESLEATSGAPPLPEPEEAAGPPPLPELGEDPPPLPEGAGPPPLPEDEGPPPLPEPTLESVEAEPPQEAPEASPGPPPGALEKAVDAFLAGHPGAAAEVERLAAQLRDKLSLDPLADAVERLVHASEGEPDDPALEMAGKVTNPAVASRLVQRLSHEEDEAERARYLVVAQRLGIVMANAFKGALTDAADTRTRRACHEGLIAMGETSRPVIEAMIEDDNRFLVQNGVAILGDMGGEGALELVTSALADTDFRVRREALGAIAKLGGEESGQLVMASLEDPDAKVRAAAAEAAGRLGVARALRPMLALLDEEDLGEEVKDAFHVQVLRGLGHLGDPGAVQAIEKRAVGSLFSKPSTEVRVAAYRALHEIGTPHARELIEKARDDKDPVVRTTVRGLASE